MYDPIRHVWSTRKRVCIGSSENMNFCFLVNIAYNLKNINKTWVYNLKNVLHSVNNINNVFSYIIVKRCTLWLMQFYNVINNKIDWIFSTVDHVWVSISQSHSDYLLFWFEQQHENCRDKCVTRVFSRPIQNFL